MSLPLLTLDEVLKDYTGRRVMVFISDHHWAVKDAATQERLFNTDELMLTKVTTVVYEAKRQECLKDTRKKRIKKTHAFVIGTIGEVEDGEYQQIDYDPFVGGYFFYTRDKFPFTKAEFAYARNHRFEVSHGEPQ